MERECDFQKTLTILEYWKTVGVIKKCFTDKFENVRICPICVYFNNFTGCVEDGSDFHKTFEILEYWKTVGFMDKFLYFHRQI